MQTSVNVFLHSFQICKSLVSIDRNNSKLKFIYCTIAQEIKYVSTVNCNYFVYSLFSYNIFSCGYQMPHGTEWNLFSFELIFPKDASFTALALHFQMTIWSFSSVKNVYFLLCCWFIHRSLDRKIEMKNIATEKYTLWHDVTHVLHVALDIFYCREIKWEIMYKHILRLRCCCIVSDSKFNPF